MAVNGTTQKGSSWGVQGLRVYFEALWVGVSEGVPAAWGTRGMWGLAQPEEAPPTPPAYPAPCPSPHQVTPKASSPPPARSQFPLTLVSLHLNTPPTTQSHGAPWPCIVAQTQGPWEAPHCLPWAQSPRPPCTHPPEALSPPAPVLGPDITFAPSQTPLHANTTFLISLSDPKPPQVCGMRSQLLGLLDVFTVDTYQPSTFCPGPCPHPKTAPHSHLQP